MQCSYCGRDIPDDAVWCPYCGAEQTPPDETTPPDGWQDENIPVSDWDDEADPPPDNTWVDDPPVPGWEDDAPYEPHRMRTRRAARRCSLRSLPRSACR